MKTAKVFAIIVLWLIKTGSINSEILILHPVVLRVVSYYFFYLKEEGSRF